MLLNESLRLIRSVNGLKAKDLAEQLGISPSFLSELESGKKEPSLDVLRKYSDCFGIKASNIVYLAEKLSEKQNHDTLKAKMTSLALSILYRFDKREEEDEE